MHTKSTPNREANGGSADFSAIRCGRKISGDDDAASVEEGGNAPTPRSGFVHGNLS